MLSNPPLQLRQRYSFLVASPIDFTYSYNWHEPCDFCVSPLRRHPHNATSTTQESIAVHLYIRHDKFFVNNSLNRTNSGAKLHCESRKKFESLQSTRKSTPFVSQTKEPLPSIAPLNYVNHPK